MREASKQIKKNKEKQDKKKENEKKKNSLIDMIVEHVEGGLAEARSPPAWRLATCALAEGERRETIGFSTTAERGLRHAGWWREGGIGWELRGFWKRRFPLLGVKK